MKFVDYHSEDEKEDKFKFFEAKIRMIKCAFCMNLPTDLKVTRCCGKYVCLACWEENRVMKPIIKKKIHFRKSCPLCDRTGMLVFGCPPLANPIVIRCEVFENLESTIVSVKDPSKFDQQKLDAVRVICPDYFCKVRNNFRLEIFIFILNI